MSERARFRKSLAGIRARSAVDDAEFARDVLRVSLNTFKKCVADTPDLRLKQRTFNAIVGNVGMDRNSFVGPKRRDVYQNSSARVPLEVPALGNALSSSAMFRSRHLGLDGSDS